MGTNTAVIAFKKNLLLGILVMVSISVSIFLLDTLLHFTTYRSFLPPVEPRGYVMFNERTGYDITPNFAPEKIVFADNSHLVWSNSIGCFDDSYSGETPYVYFTGDSFTWGWVPLEKNWTKVAGSLLGVRSLSCGVNGYGTKQELIKTSQHLSMLPSPSLIVLGYLGANDMDDDEVFPNYSVYNGYRIKNPFKCDTGVDSCTISPVTMTVFKNIRGFFARNSILFNIMNRSFHVEEKIYKSITFLKEGVITPPVLVAEKDEDERFLLHSRQMEGFKKLARDYSVPLLVVLIPSKTEVYQGIITGGSAHKQMKQFLVEQNIYYIDLLPDFIKEIKAGGTHLYWDIDGHWNERGNRFASLLVAQYIQDSGLILVAGNTAVSGKISDLLREEFSLVK